MKNLKKVTALVIVLAMALSSVAFAANFSDVAEDASYSEAVQVMTSLGLLVGYEDGTFGPDKTITRAEFAAVMVRALGMEDAAKGASVNTPFTDVPADNWASGYVQVAYQQGVILGYGDGTFGPDDEVLYEQAVKMIVCALGYQPKFANTPDAYPTSYLAQANTDGITTGTSNKIGDKASRAVVARMVYNSLDVPMMELLSLGGNNGNQYGVPTDVAAQKTLLKKNLKIAKVEATIDALHFDKDSANNVTITVTNSDKRWADYDLDGQRQIEYVDGLDVASMRGYSTVAYIDMSDDADPILKAIAPKAGKNKTLTLNPKQAGNYDADNNEISYYKVSSKDDDKALKIKLDATNFTAYGNLTTSDINSNFATIFNASVKEFTQVKLIDNNGDNRYDVAIVEGAASFVVGSISPKSYKIYPNSSALKTPDVITGRTLTNIVLDPEDTTISYSIKDAAGKALKFEDIKVDDVLNITTSSDGSATFYDIVVTNNSVKGSVSEMNVVDGINYYTIGGAEYKVATDGGSNYLKVGDSGVYIVNNAGVILYKTVDKGELNGMVGFIIGVEAKSEFNAFTYKASVMNEKGEISTLTFASKVRLNDASQKEIAIPKAGYAGDDLITDPATLKTKHDATKDSEGNSIGLDFAADESANSGKINFSKDIIMNMNKNLMIYKTNSAGEINAIYDTANVATYDADYAYAPSSSMTYRDDGRLGNYFVTEGLQLMNSDTSLATATKDALSIVNASALVDGTSYTIAGLIYNSATNDIVSGIGVNIQAIASWNAPAMVVTSVGTVNDSEGNTAQQLTGIVNGEKNQKVTITADAKIKVATNQTVTDPENNKVSVKYVDNNGYEFKMGDVVQYNAGSNGEAAGVRVLFTAAQIAANAAGIANLPVGSQNDKAFQYAGAVSKVNGRTIFFRDPNNDTGAGTNYDSVTLKGEIPTVKASLNKDGGIRRIEADSSYSEAERDENVNNIASNNTDRLVIYKYDNEPIIAIVITTDK